jgi:hypothetical protein
MKHMCAALAALLVAVVSCATPQILTVDEKLYPCGINGVYPTGGPSPCCWEGATPGGKGPGFDPTCPEDMCCYVGSDAMVGADPRRRLYSQTTTQ